MPQLYEGGASINLESISTLQALRWGLRVGGQWALGLGSHLRSCTCTQTGFHRNLTRMSALPIQRIKISSVSVLHPTRSCEVETRTVRFVRV